MKLSELAMAEPEGDAPGAAEDGGDALFASAASEAFELFQQGKKSEAAAALKSAVRSCVADYLAED